MVNREEIVAIALLTRRDMATLGSALRQVYPIDDRPCFDDLLKALDEAGPDSPVRDKR